MDKKSDLMAASSNSQASPPLCADALLEKITLYDKDTDAELIRGAYTFGKKAHADQMRSSGEPYFTHPVAVAEILISMHLDTASIITALLHDTVEDTNVTLGEIRTLFGKEVAFLVDGVTKLTHVEVLSEQAKQTEQFRKLLLAMSSDIRVLLVKLADRLHNMRTLHFVPSEEKRRRTARETLDIYAPLAERVGLRAFKDELEDLSFAELNPSARLSILSRLSFLHSQDADALPLVVQELETLLEKHHIQGTVLGREKRPYSIWQKMQRKNRSFEQLSDIMAFRILVEEIPTCYQVLGALHSHYAIVPGRFKDYISLPRNTHYQSLHTTLIGPLQKRVEIQIRTHAMNQVADLGVAAHWQYKQGFQPEKNQYQWIRELLDLLEHAENPEEFLAHTRLEMFPDQVFCFTPKGSLITLPRGANAIDFAYAVHSRVGNTCVGAKINGRLVPLRTRVMNGDQVEILTSALQSPSPAWEHSVVTAKARSNIRRFIRHKQEAEFVQLGRSLLLQAFSEANVSFAEDTLLPHLEAFECETLDRLFARVGSGGLQPQTLVCQLFPEKLKFFEKKSQIIKEPDPDKSKATVKLPIQGLIPGMAIHYAPCCHPLPGDMIVGVMTVGQGVTIHTQDCEHLAAVDISSEDFLDLSWKNNLRPTNKYVGRLALTLVNQPGALATLTTLIAKACANILNLKIRSRHGDFFELFVDLEVHNLQQFQEILAALRMSSWVLSVERWGHASY